MKMKILNRTGFVVMLVLMSLKSFSQGLSDLNYGTDSTLEIVTWNIEWFPKNGTSTIDSVKKIIEAIDVDLIGLQEISDTAAFRQMVNGIPGFELLLTDGYTGGLAYVYKTSTITVQSVYKIYNTSANRNFFPRPPVVLKFEFQGEPYIAINNHFKCCGNGQLDFGNTSDEEYRRLAASDLLKQHIEYNFFNDKVIVLGDLNDLLTDPPQHNVFKVFLDDSTNYRFADMAIAQGSSGNWSFPNWPSHLDHILITGELFSALDNAGSNASTIRVDDYLNGGFSTYDYHITDHRPVGMKLNVNSSTVGTEENHGFDAKIYPNPTNGTVSIQLEKPNVKTEISVFDVYGKPIAKQATTQQNVTINIEGAPGVYLLLIQTENQTQTKRILKF